MADTETKTISLALYRYMCQNIVGSENHVKNLRLMNTVRDNMTSETFITIITSGSFGEGLEMRGSDLDVMCVNNTIEVYENVQTSLNSNVLYLSLETDDVKAGFAQLQVKKNNRQSLVKYFEEHNGKHYFSNTLYKQALERISNSVIHGPCLSDKDGTCDYAICLHCTSWISQASQWITRSNNSWPSYKVKQSVIKHGVLFVPVGVKGSPKENIEWRISFSVGEKFLINTFTHTQLLCYALLKILLKDVISTYTECEDLLCSYFLKTIMFWISEELPQSIWKPETLTHCFMRCLRRLIYSVDYSVCLHYFIPENNLFENKIEGRARRILLDKLYKLHSYGWRCVFFSDQLSNFRVSMWMNPIEPRTLHTIELAKIVNSKLLYWASNASFGFEEDTIIKKNIQKRNTSDSFLSSIFTKILVYILLVSDVWTICAVCSTE
ncbi:cyclic GMP-AMP synthase-like receptor 2 [Mytilus edulis]|uniref:cyclic GMP-AMP synthase-like receptor 2 n=1 Tax=Mytilus edulis TaxID=6550 RepID=UPI0039F11908